MNMPAVSCLMPTFGRYSLMCRSIQCFIEQSFDDAELIVLNQSPKPTSIDHPRVTILNDSGFRTIAEARNMLMDEAQGQYIHAWDDDDLYLPWHLESMMDGMCDTCDATKPGKSWSLHITAGSCRLNENMYEASMLMKREAIEQREHMFRNDHDPHEWRDLRRSLDIRLIDMGIMASYVYVWRNKGHTSPMLDRSGPITQESVEKQATLFRAANKDYGHAYVKPVDLTECWRTIREQGVIPAAGKDAGRRFDDDIARYRRAENAPAI